MHLLPVLGNKELDIIKRVDIFALQQKWIHDGNAPGAINKYLVLLRYIFNLVLMQVDNKRQRFLTSDQAQSLINAVRNSENNVLEPIVSMNGSAVYGKSLKPKQAGLDDLCVHDLCHSFASFLINDGRSLFEVQ